MRSQNNRNRCGCIIKDTIALVLLFTLLINTTDVCGQDKSIYIEQQINKIDTKLKTTDNALALTNVQKNKLSAVYIKKYDRIQTLKAQYGTNDKYEASMKLLQIEEEYDVLVLSHLNSVKQAKIINAKNKKNKSTTDKNTP